MAEGDVAKKIQTKRRSVEAARAAHEKANEVRKSKIQNVRAVYAKEKGGPLLEDLLAKCELFKGYHLKLAQDGVGARKTGHKLVDGSEEVENFFLDNNQRAGHLDKASGIQEIVDYVERQLNPPQANPVLKPEPQA